MRLAVARARSCRSPPGVQAGRQVSRRPTRPRPLPSITPTPDSPLHFHAAHARRQRLTPVAPAAAPTNQPSSVPKTMSFRATRATSAYVTERTCPAATCPERRKARKHLVKFLALPQGKAGDCACAERPPVPGHWGSRKFEKGEGERG